MTTNNHKAFWFHTKMPQEYHEEATKGASGVVDEKIVVGVIESFAPQKEKVLVDLGIGTGRELAWIDKLKNVAKIIGIDYSPVMIDFCQKVANKCSHEVELYVDDLFKPKYSQKIAKENANNPLIYLSLINTFGNFSKSERILALRNVHSVMKPDDRVIISVYKRTQHVKLASRIKKSDHLQTLNPNDNNLLAEIIEYAGYSFFWDSVMDEHHAMPQFWYDQKNHDVAIHVNGKRVFTSHRFTRDEIAEEFTKAGLNVDDLIEGKAMWVVVGKK